MKELIRVAEGGGGEDQGINICVCGTKELTRVCSVN